MKSKLYTVNRSAPVGEHGNYMGQNVTRTFYVFTQEEWAHKLCNKVYIFVSKSRTVLTGSLYC